MMTPPCVPKMKLLLSKKNHQSFDKFALKAIILFNFLFLDLTFPAKENNPE